MVFLPNLPPVQMFDNEEFNAILEVENRGAFDMGGAGDKVYLTGFDPSVITGISAFGAQIPQLVGRDQFTPVGGIDNIAFKGRVRLLQSRYPARILATACYGYETVATANVCLDPNPFSPTIKQKVCFPSNVALGNGQGAPVAVSLVELVPSPGTARFKIHIRNVGTGVPLRQGVSVLNKCSPSSPGLAIDEVGYVQLADVSVGGVSIKHTCRPLDSDHIRLSNNAGTVFCELANVRGSSAFISPMTIILRYGYQQSISSATEIIPTSIK